MDNQDPFISAGDDPEIRILIRQREDMLREALDKLITRAEQSQLRGWFFVEPRRVEATLEGAASQVASILGLWHTLMRDKAPQLELSYSRAEGNLPPVECITDPQAIKRLHRQLRERRKAPAPAPLEREKTKPSLGPLRDLEGFKAKKEPKDYLELRQMLLDNIDVLAGALGVEPELLKVLAKETEGTSLEELHYRVIEKFGDYPNANLDMLKTYKLKADPRFLKGLEDETEGASREEMHSMAVDRLRASSDVDPELILKISPDQIQSVDVPEPKHGAPLPAAPDGDQALLALAKAFGPAERALIHKAQFEDLRWLIIVSPNLAARSWDIEQQLIERLRLAACLASFKGMEPELAAALAKRGTSLEKISSMPAATLREVVRAALKAQGSRIDHAYKSTTELIQWREAARNLRPVLDVLDEAQTSIRIHVDIHIRFPWEDEDAASPAPPTTQVRLVARYEEKPPPMSQVRPWQSARLRKDELDQLRGWIDQAPKKLAEQLRVLGSDTAYFETDHRGRPGNEVMLVSGTPFNGALDLLIWESTMRDLPENVKLFLEIEFDGIYGSRYVRIDHVVDLMPYWSECRNALKPASVDYWGDLYASPILPFSCHYFRVPVIAVVACAPADSCADCDALPANLDVPATFAQNTGPFELWPENSFSLYGTVAEITLLPDYQQGDENYTATYLSERDLIDSLLDDLKPNGALLGDLRADIKERFAACGMPYPPGPTQSNQVPGHSDIWALFGVVTGTFWPDISSDLLWHETRRDKESFREFGNGIDGLLLEDDIGNKGIFHHINEFRWRLRANRQRIQDLKNQGVNDIWNYMSSDELAFVPYVYYFYFAVESCWIWGDCSTDVIADGSDFPLYYPISTLSEIDRVLPIVDGFAAKVNYHYYRQRALTIFRLLNEGHSALGKEEFGIALGKYTEADELLAGVLADILFLHATLPPETEGGLYVHRAMSTTMVFDPVDDMSRFDELFVTFGLFCLFSLGRDEEICGLAAAMASDQKTPILDGEIRARLIEDVFYYLKEFVIPACKGEAHLRRAEIRTQRIETDYDVAICYFIDASEYLTSSAYDSTASHYLWLRVARAYLRKGYHLFASATFLDPLHRQQRLHDARATLSVVLCDRFGVEGQIRVSGTEIHDSLVKQNPVVVGMRIEACNHIANIDAGINHLGYPENYIPALRWSWLMQQARARAQEVVAAEQLYIQFRVNAENEDLRLLQFGHLEQTAFNEIGYAHSNTIVAQQQLSKSSDEIDNTRDALQRAEDALSEHSFLSALRGIFSDFSLIISKGATFGSSINLMTNDAFEYSQIERKVEELQDALVLAERNFEVAQRALDSVRAQESLARLKYRLASEALAFEQHREFNYARWFALADEMQDIVRFRLRSALQLTYFAQQAFYYMTSILVPIVQSDEANLRAQELYSQGATSSTYDLTSGYLLGEHILNALTVLEDQWMNFLNQPDSDYQGRESSTPSLVEEIRFELGSPSFNFDRLQWERLRTGGGTLEFEIRLDQLDCRLPGAFQCLIEHVEIFGLITNIGSQGTLRARLQNSPYSVVRVRDPDNLIQAGLAESWEDWIDASGLGFKTILKPQRQENLWFSHLTTPDSTGNFSTPLLGQFEYNGVAQRWTLDIPARLNTTLAWDSIQNLGIRFTYSQRYLQELADDIVSPACSGRTRGSLLLIQIWDNFFNIGTNPQDRIANLPLLESDFPQSHRTNPTLINISCMFVPKRNAAPLPSIRFYLSCDQYLNSSREPIEVAADTMVMTLDDGTLGQIAFSNTDDLATPNPLNIFGDQFLTDSVVTPWITLLTGPTNALVGTAFTLRVNLTENPGFNFSDLAYVILHLEYIFG